MTRTNLARLQRLRAKRKDMALKQFVASQTKFDAADSEATVAQAAAVEHAAMSRAREHNRLNAQLGKQLGTGDIADLQMTLDALADRQAELRTLEQAAHDRRDAVHAELEAVRALFLRRYRDDEKLQALIARVEQRQAPRRAAMSETTDDEFSRR
jgi:FtsZ-binding cell division protein ZapB